MVEYDEERLPLGWVCPKCGLVNAPQAQWCPMCVPNATRTTVARPFTSTWNSEPIRFDRGIDSGGTTVVGPIVMGTERD